jgi:hypothetical protein
MGLALISFLVMGLALHTFADYGFMFDLQQQHKKRKYIKLYIIEGISVAHLSAMTLMVSKLQRCVSACHRITSKL